MEQNTLILWKLLPHLSSSMVKIEIASNIVHLTMISCAKLPSDNSIHVSKSNHLVDETFLQDIEQKSNGIDTTDP